MYYAAIRRYKTNEYVTLEEIQPALDSLVPLIRERVIAYYVLDGGMEYLPPLASVRMKRSWKQPTG